MDLNIRVAISMKRRKLSTNTQRRDFLKRSLLGGAVAFSNPTKLIIATLFAQSFSKAHAVTTGVGQDTDFNVVNFHMEGAPIRIPFDKLLKPNGTDGFVANPAVGTTLSGSILDYQTVAGPLPSEYNGYYFPKMWEGNIPTPTGSAPMRNLAPNTLVINYEHPIDSHELNQANVIRPLPGGPSVTGLVADAATTPIPAIQYTNSSNQDNKMSFGSSKGLSEAFVYGNDPLSLALGAFNVSSDPQNELSTSGLEAAIDSLFAQLKTESSSEHQYSPTGLYDTRKASRDLMKRNFGNLVTTFSTLKTKYSDLINKSMTGSFTGYIAVPGLEDVALPGSSSDYSWNISWDGTAKRTTFSGTDFRSAFTSAANAQSMAESFAVAEFMLTQRISSALNLRLGGITGLIFGTDSANAISLLGGSTNNGSGFPFDMHGTGAKAELVLMTKFYRGFAACLLELKTRLSAVSLPNGKNLWQQTVVILNSEFGRRPRNDKGGSEHSPIASNTTVFSGMITSAEVVGNIKSDPNPGASVITAQGGSSYGSYGQAAPVAVNNNRPIGLGNVISTICLLLNVPSPTSNDTSVGSKNASGNFVRNFPRSTGT